MECTFLSDQKGTKESPGSSSEEYKHSSRLPPDPVTGDASRTAIPQRRRGWYSRLSPLPRRCRWPGNQRKQSGWTKKARRLPPAVGAGPDMTGQIAWHKPGGPSGSGRPQLSPYQGPVAQKEGHTPLRVCPPEGTTYRRGPAKNGVLVPLPPRAKEPAAGAAEFPHKSSRRDWQLCGRMVSAPTPFLLYLYYPIHGETAGPLSRTRS